MVIGVSIGDFVIIYTKVDRLIKKYARAPEEVKVQQESVTRSIRQLQSITSSLESSCIASIPTHSASELGELVRNVIGTLEQIEEHLGNVKLAGKGLRAQLRYHVSRARFNPKEIASLWQLVGHGIFPILLTIQSAKDKQERLLKTLDWISPYSLDATPRGLADTCAQVLDSPTLQSWEAGKGKCLFFHGQPGVGKTTMVSMLVSRLADKYRDVSGVGIVSLDFQRVGLRSLDDVFLSILRQLCEKRPDTLTRIPKLRESHTINRRLTGGAVTQALVSVAPDFINIFLFLDGIDEFATLYQNQLLSTLLGMQAGPLTNLNIFGTSSVQYRALENHKSQEFRAANDDIATYFNREAARGGLPPALLQNGRIREEDMGDICIVCDGNFLVATLLMQEAAEVLTRADFRKLLRDLKEAGTDTPIVERLVDGIIQKIENQSQTLQKRARNVMMWICLGAWTPLTDRELCELFGVFSHGSAEGPMEEIHILDLLHPCRGLVKQSPQLCSAGTTVISFAHRVIETCVKRAWFSDDPMGCHAAMAEMLLVVLTTSQTVGSIYGLAAFMLPYHLHRAAGKFKPDKAMKFLLNRDAVGRACEVLLLDSKRKTGRSGLFLAAHFGLVPCMEALVACGQDAHIQDEERETPLMWAVGNLQHDAEAWLLKQDVDPDAQNTHRRTALHLAAVQGNRKSVRQLLDHDANPAAVTEYGETPLHAVVARRLYRLKGRQVGHPDQPGDRLWNDNDQQIEIVLDYIPLPDDDLDDEAYDVAVEYIIEEIVGVVQDLLSCPATDVNARTEYGCNALHLIDYAYRGRWLALPLVTALLAAGADVSAKNANGQTPLMIACFGRNFAAAAAFLDAGADATETDNLGRNALHYAVHRGRDLETIRLLLEHLDECHVDAVDNSEMTPLAAHFSDFLPVSEAIVYALLSLGAGVMHTFTETKMGLGHLYAARCCRLDINIFKLLADAGLNLQAVDAQGKNILHHIATSGSLTEAVLQYLVHDAGLAVDTRDSTGKTALDYATQHSETKHHEYTFNCDGWRRTKTILECWPDVERLDAALKTLGRCPEHLHYRHDILYPFETRAGFVWV